ncbi:MAG: acyl carrier protein [Solirubrobacterales bacterium]|nr:acyl carrier protein [Solirubrobacterales bacterium]
MSEATMDQVEARVVDALESFGAERSDISRDATFEALDIDSIDLVELAQLVKDEFGVEIQGRDLADVKTVGDALDIIEARMGAA